MKLSLCTGSTGSENARGTGRDKNEGKGNRKGE